MKIKATLMKRFTKLDFLKIAKQVEKEAQGKYVWITLTSAGAFSITDVKPE